MIGGRSGKPSSQMLRFAVLTAIGMEATFLSLLWRDASRQGLQAAVLQHPLGVTAGFVLWGLLPGIFFVISRILKKQGR
jgi:hypothetical protein